MILVYIALAGLANGYLLYVFHNSNLFADVRARLQTTDWLALVTKVLGWVKIKPKASTSEWIADKLQYLSACPICQAFWLSLFDFLILSPVSYFSLTFILSVLSAATVSAFISGIFSKMYSN